MGPRKRRRSGGQPAAAATGAQGNEGGERDDAAQNVALKRGDRVAIDGCARVEVLSGVVDMGGYRLSAGAQRAGAAVSVVGASGGAVLVEHAAAPDVPRMEADEALLRVAPDPEAREGARPPCVLRSGVQAQAPAAAAPSAWTAAVDEVLRAADAGTAPGAGAPVVVVAGPKGAGKSTFARLLANALLSRRRGGPAAIAFLETDVGQCEFTPPGLVALHVIEPSAPVLGLPHAHLRTWRRAAFVGDISPKADVRAFAEAVAALATEARNELCGVPLLVNTGGWVTGAGLDILTDTLRAVAPTHLVALGPLAGNSRGLPRGVFWENQGSTTAPPGAPPCRVIDLPALPTPQGGGGGGSEAADARTAALLAYFHPPTALAAEPASVASVAAAATALAAHRPYAAPRAALGVRFLHAEVPRAHESAVLNGSVVALARPWRGGGGEGAAYGAPPFECIALAIIRSVDDASSALYVLTPAAPEALATASTLLHGRVELPAGAYTPPRMRAAYVLPHALNTEGVGAAVQKSRNNIQRNSGGGGGGA